MPVKLNIFNDRIDSNLKGATNSRKVAPFTVNLIKWIGSVPEWLMGADCKSAGLPTLVQIQFGPIEKCGCGGMVDTGDLKSPAGDGMRVQFPPATS